MLRLHKAFKTTSCGKSSPQKLALTLVRKLLTLVMNKILGRTNDLRDYTKTIPFP